MARGGSRPVPVPLPSRRVYVADLEFPSNPLRKSAGSPGKLDRYENDRYRRRVCRVIEGGRDVELK